MKKVFNVIWKGKRKIVTIVFVLVLAAAYMLTSSMSPKSYEGIKIEKGYISETIYLNGKTSSANESDIYAQSMGDVFELKLKIGDRVKAGDVLMVLKNDDLQKKLEDLNMEKSIQLSAGSNSEASSKLSYEQAKQSYESNVALYDAGIISKEVLDNSKYAMENAFESYKSSQSLANTNALRVENIDLQIKRVRESMEKLTVKSTIDGVLSYLPYKEGDKVNLGQVIARVQDDSVLYVNANVNQFDIKNIKLGQMAMIYENLPNSPKYEAVVHEISPVGKLDSQGSEVSIPIKIKFDNSKDVFRANYVLKIEIVANEKHDALLLPYEAVNIDADGKKQVYKFEEMKAKPVAVEYGISGDIKVEILSDELKEGDVIIANPDQMIANLPAVNVNMPQENPQESGK